MYVRAAGSAPVLRVNESFYELSNPAIRAYQSSVAHCFPEQAMPKVVSVAPASGFVSAMFFFGFVCGILIAILYKAMRRCHASSTKKALSSVPFLHTSIPFRNLGDTEVAQRPAQPSL